MGYLSEIARANRTRIVRKIAADGGCMKDVTAALGIEANNANYWVRTWHPDLHRTLKENGRQTNSTPGPEALARLYAVRAGRAAGKRNYQIAENLGISAPALSTWLKRWARDGVDQTIEDLEPYQDEPCDELEAA